MISYNLVWSYKISEIILYVADKREENRHIDDEVVGIAKYDLKKAIRTLREKWEEDKNNGIKG